MQEAFHRLDALLRDSATPASKVPRDPAETPWERSWRRPGTLKRTASVGKEVLCSGVSRLLFRVPFFKGVLHSVRTLLHSA